MKHLAKELDVPVIAVSKLNREVEKRAGSRRLQLSYLWESGAIEQDADLVLFISRDEMEGSIGGDGAADITIAKQRNGSTGSIKLTFQKRFTRFFDFAQEA